MADTSAPYDDGSLVDLLDRLMDVGAVIAGDVVLALAGVDLMRLDLRLLLASVQTRSARGNDTSPATGSSAVAPSRPIDQGGAQTQPPRRTGTSSGTQIPARIDGSSDRGLGRLVLAVVELLRQLMQRQALHRLDGGSLRPDEIERLGLALMQLEEQMNELCAAFGLRHGDVQTSLENLLGHSSPDHRRTA
jgi:hypothetical protein